MNASDPTRKKRGAGRRAGVWGWDEGQERNNIVGKALILSHRRKQLASAEFIHYIH